MEALDALLSEPLGKLLAKCRGSQQNVLAVALSSLLQGGARPRDIALKLCAWIQRCLNEINADDGATPAMKLEFVANSSMFLGAMAEFDQEGLCEVWWEQAGGALEQLVLVADEKDRLEEEGHVAQIERCCAALCTRSSKLRAALRERPGFLKSCYNLRWSGNGAFILKSVTMAVEDDDSDLVLWIDPLAETAHEFRLNHVTENQQMCCLVGEALKSKGPAPRMFNWFAWAGKDALEPREKDRLDSAVTPALWTSSGVFFAGVPFDIAECPHIEGHSRAKRVVLAISGLGINFQVRNEPDFPWVEPPASVEVVSVLSKEKTRQILAALENVSLRDKIAAVREERVRTNCNISPEVYATTMTLYDRFKAQEIEVGADVLEEGKVTLASIWKFSRLWFASPDSLVDDEVDFFPECPWCQVAGRTAKPAALTSAAVVNLVRVIKEEIFRSIVDGTFESRELPPIAGARGDCDTTSCAACGKTVIQ